MEEALEGESKRYQQELKMGPVSKDLAPESYQIVKKGASAVSGGVSDYLVDAAEEWVANRKEPASASEERSRRFPQPEVRFPKGGVGISLQNGTRVWARDKETYEAITGLDETWNGHSGATVPLTPRPSIDFDDSVPVNPELGSQVIGKPRRLRIDHERLNRPYDFSAELQRVRRLRAGRGATAEPRLSTGDPQPSLPDFHNNQPTPSRVEQPQTSDGCDGFWVGGYGTPRYCYNDSAAE
jgi:hypothetical protein